MHRPITFIFLAVLALFLSGGCVVKEGTLSPQSKVMPPLDINDPEGSFTMTGDYARHDLHGWTILVNPSMDDHPRLKQQVMDLMSDQLYRITRKVPSPALDRLREVEIWVEYEMPKTKCMCYHVSRSWLVPNGYNPDKEGTVEVGNAQAFIDWTQGQPWMVLHELAHAYHDQVLGFDDAGVRAAWQTRKDAGDYESVLHISGKPRRHYALTNDKEYFAETTESWFGTNDFHPFVRAELEQVDPAGAELMRETWYESSE